MALGRSAVLVSALAVGALLATGTTYAAFSDYAEVTGNEVVAGTVVIGGDGGAAPDLAYAGLVPGVEKSDAMAVRYAGSIPADVWLELEPGSATQSFCVSSAGSWAAKSGGALQIRVGDGGWQDYCAAVGGQRFDIANDVQPDTTLDVQVAVRLVDGTDVRYSGLTGVDGLVVKALQAGGQGFSDFVRGTITIGADTIAPVVPQQCLDAGLHFDASSTVYLTGEDDTFDVGQQPEQGRGYLIFALGGDDVVTGSNQADCIVGGTGDDHLIGGNQGDVLLGSDGDDVLNGAGEAADDRSGGNGKDWLYGEAGDDELHGANGKDHLDGGDHVDGDLCVDEPNGNSSGSADDNPGGNGHDTFVGCEVGGPSDGPGNAPAVEAGPAQSQSSDSLDTGEQLDRQTDGGSDQQAGTAAQGTTAATQPSTASTTQPSVAPTSDGTSADEQTPTSSPSTSPLSGPEPEVQTTTP